MLPAVAGGVLDLATAQADIGEHAVIQCEQHVGVAAKPTVFPDLREAALDRFEQHRMPGPNRACFRRRRRRRIDDCSLR